MSEEQFLKDLDILTTNGRTGFYSRCEVTELFIYEKQTQRNFNLLTLLVFEDAAIPDECKRYLTNKPLSIPKHKEYCLGIAKYYKSIEEIKGYFPNFVKLGVWSLYGKILKTPSFKFLPKQYVPSSYRISSANLNSILKNNFRSHSGSYILECFDENKVDVQFLLKDPKALDELSHSVSKYIPLGLAKNSDRLGNIILQFPLDMVSVKSLLQNTRESVTVDIAWNPKIIEKPECEVCTITEFDQVFWQFNKFKLDYDASNIQLKNYSKDLQAFLVDTNNQLILASWIKTSYVQQIGIDLQMLSHEPRVFHVKSPGETEKQHRINLSSRTSNINVGIHQSRTHLTCIEERLYEEELTELEISLSFVQYGINGSGREKALQDIRTLIKKYGQNGIYLWDPYLSATDILETLYFCESSDAVLRAISSYDNNKKDVYQATLECQDDSLNINSWIEKNANILTTSDKNNNFGIDLEFRVQHGNYGWKFHDRFLIFPNYFNKVQVWSLGTSINSLGKQHHILQKVSNSRRILDAFNDLWEKLNHQDCLVKKYPT